MMYIRMPVDIKRKRINGLQELGVKKDGIYCIFPFDSFDKHKKGCFKIGIATSGTFYNRLEQGYHTYYPMGFYYVAFLENPTKEKQGRTHLSYYRAIERYIFDNIEGENVFTNARTVKEGRTEWIYTNLKCIYAAFELAFEKFGGKQSTIHIVKFDKNTFKNEQPPYFQGKINFVEKDGGDPERKN